jgi:hypothetical protein
VYNIFHYSTSRSLLSQSKFHQTAVLSPIPPLVNFGGYSPGKHLRENTFVYAVHEDLHLVSCAKVCNAKKLDAQKIHIACN